MLEMFSKLPDYVLNSFKRNNEHLIPIKDEESIL